MRRFNKHTARNAVNTRLAQIAKAAPAGECVAAIAIGSGSYRMVVRPKGYFVPVTYIVRHSYLPRDPIRDAIFGD